MLLIKDIVDILIGWYIEPLPTDRILEYTAQALHRFRPFWIEQLEATTLTLLEHFIEDADSYAQVNEQNESQTARLTGRAVLFQQFESQAAINEENIVSFTDKIAALYR